MAADVLALVRDTIRRHAMLAGGETVLIALSGGADSTALLYVLARLAPAWSLRLHALHVDHGLREGSGQEAHAVRRLGQQVGVPVEVARVTVSRHGSLEEAARTARYAALQAHADRLGAQRIALGHTADDQAETVIMRLLEGAGVRGLAAIPPVRGRIIRPLIGLRRAALVAVLADAGIPWIEDPSNLDRKFLRNRIRHDLLPMLTAVHDADLVDPLCRVAHRAREVLDALEGMAVLELERMAREEPDALLLPRGALTALPLPVAIEVLRQAIGRSGGRTRLRAWAQRRLARALTSPPPRRPVTVGGVMIDVSGSLVRVGRSRSVALPARPVPVPGVVALPEVGLQLEAVLAPAAGYRVPREPERVAFDAQRLTGPLIVRGRRRGDRIRAFGDNRERRLRQLLIDAKVPRWDRDRLPLVEVEGSIVWVGGLRRGAQAAVTPDSREILELRLQPLDFEQA
ncbi:MAG TPA: tRNA lysidine(34) synthetase TilS [Methylomirabilota bacterium]|nr:tRNA lysidine(34) synthetase TilS [Methylomirabilota bacterium]